MANESVKFTIELGGNAYSGVVQLDNAVRQVVKTASQAKTSFQSLGNAYVALDALVGTVDRISGVFDSLVGSSLAFEQTQANMRTLMNGNAEAADAMLGKIREYGKNTVYDTSGLVEAQKTMMSFGIESEKAFSTLKQIGDIAMGDSNKMQSLALAFSQTTSTGKLMGQDLLQMINAGFNPLQVISEKTGKSIGTLKDEMSKGAISADMVAQAFQWATEEGALFYQGAEMAGQTVGGRIATMRDTIDEWKISLFEATGGLTAYVSEIGKMASPLASIVGIIPLIGNGFSSVKTKAIEAWSAIGKGTMWCKKQLIAMSTSAQLSGGAFQLMGIMAKSACRTISMAIMNIPIVGWIAAAVTLVVMLFKQLWDKCYGFRVVVFTVWEGLKSVFSWVQEGMRGGLYMDFWTGETIKAFRTAVRGWLKEIKSYDTLVSDNQTINFVDLGGDPEVLINQSSYPIDVTNLEDANRAIKLDKYQTTATKITEDEAIGLSYDKKATVIERHKEVVEETKYKKALHALAPSENTADTPVLTTTGAANGTRKRMVIADIIALKEKFDKMRVPAQGRVLVLSAEHANDLIREDASFFQRNIDVATGQLKPIYGFKVYEDIDTPTFDATTLKKVAYDAVLDPEKHSVASVAFYAPRMMQATGVTRSYVAEPTPTTQEYLYNLRHYFICLPKKEKQSIAAIVSGIVG